MVLGPSEVDYSKSSKILFLGGSTTENNEVDEQFRFPFLAPFQLSKDSKSSFMVTQQRKFRLISIILAFSGFMFLLPLFNTDRIQLIGMKRGDANLVMKATFSYPESTVRYSLIGRELYNSGLLKESLEVARSGVEFNPNSPAMWALILVNQNATPKERLNAKNKILILDPLNKDVKNFNP